MFASFPTPPELTDASSQAPGKAAQSWFFPIHCQHKQEFLTELKNTQTSKSQMVNRGEKERVLP